MRTVLLYLVSFGLGLAACNTTTGPSIPPPPSSQTTSQQYTPVRALLDLPDKTAFSQKDPRWGSERLGGSGESLASDGCVITSAAMALGNLGIRTDPKDLNKRLKENGGYTAQGWLIWGAIEKVTDGQASARYYKEVNADIIKGCMKDGYYPLARFILPSGRSHWAMIVRKSELGYHMRDPLHPSKKPLIFPRGVDAFKSVRCIGPKAGSSAIGH